MWIIFEGLDKAGKTTLEWELLKATNYKHVVIDRGPAGYITFDKIFGRCTQQSENDMINQAKTACDSGDFIIAYCHVRASIASKRLRAFNETCPYDYDKAKRLYEEEIKMCYDDKYVVDIDTGNPKEWCIDKIVEKIKEFDCEFKN